MVYFVYINDGWNESKLFILHLHSCHRVATLVSKIYKNCRNTVSIILVNLKQVYVLDLCGHAEVDSLWYIDRFVLRTLKPACASMLLACLSQNILHAVDRTVENKCLLNFCICQTYQSCGHFTVMCSCSFRFWCYVEMFGNYYSYELCH